MPVLTSSRGRLLASAMALALLVQPAPAQTSRRGTSSNQPVLLSADTLRHDEQLGIITATGRVELAQGPRIILADTVSYSEKTNVVIASGHVSMLEPTGDVIFAEYVELGDDMRQGFIDQARMLLADNSRLAARQGERVDGRFIRLTRGVYSPCEPCRENPDAPPLWQIRAAAITQDQQTHDILYDDAVMEIGGVPVAWLPYFSHPDPTVKRRSGFLNPGGGLNGDLGTFARLYYYFDIDPTKDFTLEAVPSTKDGLLLGGTYRQRFGTGLVNVTASGVFARRTENTSGTEIGKNEFRGRIFTDGRFDINDEWRWGFDLKRVSDNSFLRRYAYGNQDLLTSRAYVERFQGRDYLSINAYDFQDLRPSHAETEPRLLPLINYSAFGEPGQTLGGRWELNADLQSLTRSKGAKSHRLSGGAGWERSFFSPIGLVSTFSTSVEANAYVIRNYVLPGETEPDGYEKLRIYPQANWTTSLPLARQDGSVQELIEPLIMLSAAPVTEDSDLIPNEDSQEVEFDHTNLFRPSRFPGHDRFEGGQRLTYGLRGGVFGFGGGGSSFFLGQSWRLQREGDFPTGAGLLNRLSDVVGKLELTPSPWVDISYSFRLDAESLAQRRHEAYGTFGPSEFRVSASYLYLNRLTLANSDGSTVTDNREELAVGVTSALTSRWSVGISHRNDLAANGGPIGTGLALTYQNDCLTFQLLGERDYTKRSGLTSGDKIYFRLVFKNLGEFLSPSISPNSFSNGSSSTR